MTKTKTKTKTKQVATERDLAQEFRTAARGSDRWRELGEELATDLEGRGWEDQARFIRAQIARWGLEPGGGINGVLRKLVGEADKEARDGG